MSSEEHVVLALTCTASIVTLLLVIAIVYSLYKNNKT